MLRAVDVADACARSGLEEDMVRTVARRVAAAQSVSIYEDLGIQQAPHSYEEHPPRYEYELTDKGRAFFDVLAAMWSWGSEWLWKSGGPPVVLVDRETRREVRPVVVDQATGERIDVRRLRAVRARCDEGSAQARRQ